MRRLLMRVIALILAGMMAEHLDGELGKYVHGKHSKAVEHKYCESLTVCHVGEDEDDEDDLAA